ncbi:MAG: YceH family protein [Isosphaeraceae bacterium]
MSQSESTAGAAPAWVPLSPRERRVVGVLAEKMKTTPEYYPMTVAALVSGCNQKSNRDPVTNYDQDDVEDTLQGLRKKGATVLVESGGRVPRWKHTLYDWLRASKAEMAVLIELLLRGPQTEGELRSRASRMEPLSDLAALQTILDSLAARGLVVYLSPPGQRRGVMVTHGLYPPDELEKVRAAFAASAASGDEEGIPSRASAARAELSAAAAAPAWAGELAAAKGEIEDLKIRLLEVTTMAAELKAELSELRVEVRDLKSALGA